MYSSTTCKIIHLIFFFKRLLFLFIEELCLQRHLYIPAVNDKPASFQKGRYPIKTNVKIRTVLCSSGWIPWPPGPGTLSSSSPPGSVLLLRLLFQCLSFGGSRVSNSSSISLRPVPCYLLLISPQLLEGCGFTFLECVQAGCGVPLASSPAS